MRAQHAIRNLIGVGVIGGLIVVLLMLAATALPFTHQLSNTASVSNPCISSDTGTTSPNVIEQCVAAKATYIAAAERDQLATAAARPTEPPQAPLQGRTPIPTGFVPPEAQQIFRTRRGDVNAFFELKGVPNVWHIGGVTSSVDPYSYSDVYAYAAPLPPTSRATLALTIWGNFVGNQERAWYQRRWEVPMDVGTMTITNVTGPTISPTGPTGIVAFTTSTGKTGTFNLATQVWTIDGALYQAATPAPQSNQPYPAPAPTP